MAAKVDSISGSTLGSGCYASEGGSAT